MSPGRGALRPHGRSGEGRGLGGRAGGSLVWVTVLAGKSEPNWVARASGTAVTELHHRQWSRPFRDISKPQFQSSFVRGNHAVALQTLRQIYSILTDNVLFSSDDVHFHSLRLQTSLRDSFPLSFPSLFQVLFPPLSSSMLFHRRGMLLLQLTQTSEANS